MLTMFVISCSLVIHILYIPYETSLGLYSWLGNFILLCGIITFKKIKGTHINPYTMFFLSYYFFSFGQPFLFSVGIEYEEFNLLRLFPQEDILLYCLFFCVSTCFMLLGALIAIKKDSNIQILSSELKQDDIVLNNAVKIVAWLMFIVSTPMYLNNLISNMIRSIKYGYRTIYEVDETTSAVSNVIESLDMWFITSIILLLVVYKSNKLIRSIIMLLFVFIILGMFIVGGRGGAMAMLCSLIFIWNAEIKKFTRTNKVTLSIGLLIIFSLLPVIQNFRATEYKTIEDFLEILKLMYKDNLYVDIIGELGSSMQPWLLTYDLIPENYSFKLGQSFIASFLAVIPSVLLGGHSFTEYTHLSGWLMEVNNMSYGPGFSLLAESYYNFAWFGAVFMFVIGWFIFKLISNNMLRGKILRYKNAFSAIALYLFITIARSSLYLGVRKEVYSIILPILAIMILYASLKKKARKTS
ncbi:O-antigen polysaccharide polymerase Wzy [Bacillus infantis]|uniref:O-antigen polysaccharide polymerase Wzy n=1 Tax=Bacillus infantis TaxID=324767 RepID=UPI00344E438F